MTFLDTLKDIALPFVTVAAIAEGLWFLAARKKYDWAAWATSAGDLIVRRLLNLVPFALTAPVFAWAYGHRLYTFHLHDAGSVLLLFVGLEFCYYWQHRASHTIRWFWNAHLVHHSPNQLTLAAAYRLGWFDKFIGTGVFLTPLSFLGFHPLDVVAALFLNLLYQFWLHADWIPKLGVLEYVLNTPSAHRVHHARNPAYLDANFGGVLIVFDRLFGTYVEERDDLPCQYGLVHPVTTYNPVRINLQPWIDLARDLARARSLGEAWNYLFGAPGWRPNGEGMTTAELRAADLRAADLKAAD